MISDEDLLREWNSYKLLALEMRQRRAPRPVRIQSEKMRDLLQELIELRAFKVQMEEVIRVKS